MTYQVTIKKCGCKIYTIDTEAADALMAISIAEKEYPVKVKQVVLGDRPVMWTGLEYEARRV